MVFMGAIVLSVTCVFCYISVKCFVSSIFNIFLLACVLRTVRILARGQAKTLQHGIWLST